MYLYQPCLLTMSLYAWAFDDAPRRRIWFQMLFPLALRAVSEIELSYTHIMLYPSALLLPAFLFAGSSHTVSRLDVTTASLIGGFLCWKASDMWPLFSGLPLFCAVLLLIPALLLCREREDRLLACALGGLLYELFFCLKEYMLFSFCVIRLGSGDSLSVSSTAICLYALYEQIRLVLRPKGKGAVFIGK